MPITDKALREAIVETFSIDDLDIVRADLQAALARRGVNMRLGRADLGGNGYEQQVLNLIQALKRRNQLQALIDVVRAERPELFASESAVPGVAPAPAAGGVVLPEWRVDIRMKKVPTSIYHLLTADKDPLFTCEVRNNTQQRNVRVTAYIADYSVDSVDNEWLDPNETHSFQQLPRFKPGVIGGLDDVRPATLNVKVDDLTDDRVLAQKTFDVSLYPPTTVLLEVQDVLTSEWKDMTPYVAAFVTPNALAVQRFIRDAIAHVEGKQFVGYQGGAARVTPQVRGLFDAFNESDITYNSFVQAFDSQPGIEIQRVQLPRQSLDTKLANCIDGQVLFASALEGIGLSAALVYIQEPAGGHALVAWETAKGNGDWQYLDTTRIATDTFDVAAQQSTNLAKGFESVAAAANNTRLFRRWPLTKLRADGITPME
jgi:hypothetical protein